MTSEAGCLACDLRTGARPLPGGRVHQTSGWIVEHCIGPLGVGTLVVKPARHVLHVAELTDAEAAELGPLLRRTAAAVSEIVRPDQVYVCLWSHAGGRPGHLHFVVQPVTTATMARHQAHGPNLQVAMSQEGTPPPEAEVVDVCERLRRHLAGDPGR